MRNTKGLLEWTEVRWEVPLKIVMLVGLAAKLGPRAGKHKMPTSGLSC